MEWSVITVVLLLLFLSLICIVYNYKTKSRHIKVLETYNNYFNEDLFKNLKYPEDNICFDEFMPHSELGIVNANNRYLNARREISKTDFIELLNNLSNKYGVLQKNTNNIMNSLKCTTQSVTTSTTGVNNDDENSDCFQEMRIPAKRTPLSYDLCKRWLIGEINNEIFKYDQTTEYGHVPFTVHKNRILVFKQLINDIKNIDYYKFLATIHRDSKNKVFTIGCEILYDKLSSEYTIISLDLEGLTTNEYSSDGFLDFYKNKKEMCDYYGVSCTLSERPECKNHSDDHFQNELLKRRKEHQKEMNSKCFYKDAKTKEECISIDVNGCSGVWDSKCVKDTDCPFFGKKGNVNYSNKRGGCKKDGFCELPLNMINIGYRKYSDLGIDRPLCHNCPNIVNCIGKECSQCCDLQGDSPDYAFEFDKPFRRKYQDLLKEKGLKYFDINF
jgi:hypothetical protein